MPSPMGRRRTRDFDLPPLMIRRRGRFYYGRQQIALGADFPAALRKYVEVHTGHSPAGTFGDAADAYRKAEDGLKACRPSTQREYERQLAVLIGSFGKMHVDRILPMHVRAFMREVAKKQVDAKGRVTGGPIIATRMKALLSLVINFARENGIAHGANPCAGIRGKKSARDVEVTDAMLAPVLKACVCPVTRDYVETLFRTGADAGVAAVWRRDAIVGDELVVQRTKTGAKVRIAIVGPLKAILERRLAERVGNVYLFARQDGEPIGLQVLRRRFIDARTKAGQSFWLKDLRAKAATDADDLRAAQDLLGHAQESTTALYRRKRAGVKAKPITREIAGK